MPCELEAAGRKFVVLLVVVRPVVRVAVWLLLEAVVPVEVFFLAAAWACCAGVGFLTSATVPSALVTVPSAATFGSFGNQ